MSTKTARRWFTTAVAALLVATGAVFGTASPAMAYSGYIYEGPSGSYGFFDVDFVPDRMRLLSNPTILPAGKCVDMWFDWFRGAQHYDARVSRSCRSSQNRNTGTTYETVDVTGYNKVAACYGNNNATTSGTCETRQGSASGLVPNIPNPCTRAWWLTSGGTYNYNAGGSSTSCTS